MVGKRKGPPPIIVITTRGGGEGFHGLDDAAPASKRQRRGRGRRRAPPRDDSSGSSSEDSSSEDSSSSPSSDDSSSGPSSDAEYLPSSSASVPVCDDDGDADGEKRGRPRARTPKRNTSDGGKKKKVKDKVKDKISNVAYDGYLSEECEYYDAAEPSMRRQIAQIEQRMRDINETKIPLRFKVLLSEVDEKVKAVAVKKLDALYNLDESSGEYHKIMAWIDALCRLPVNKYAALPVDYRSDRGAVREFLRSTRERLHERVYGHDTAKEQIIRLIAQWVTNPSAKGMVIGIHGSCGVGKTTLVKDGICNVLGIPFAFLPLGGASDAAYLEGHSYTYEGSTWGKIVDVLMKCRVSNPVLYFDELDKVSTSHRGDEIINKLIHLTDSSQNERFADKFFYDVDIDLSRCLIIFSYNREDCVSPILRDRMVCIRTEGYTLKDKKNIARDFLVPTTLAEFKLTAQDIVFTDDIISFIVEYVEKEEGVRNLKRALHEIVSSLNLKGLERVPDQPIGSGLDSGFLDSGLGPFPVQVTKDHVLEFVKSSTCHDGAKTAWANMMYV